MTSKEALKYLLVNSKELLTVYPEDKNFYLYAVELHNIVSKDLDRLEKLEKENQELKEQINRFQKVIEDIKNLPSYIGIGFKNMFDNCKLTSLPESPELENELEKLRSYKNDSCR